MSEKITAADAIRLLDAHEAAAVDVREPDEFAVGHIPGAKLLPLGQVLSRAAEVLPDKNAVWLVYCRTGRRSADAVRKLESLGSPVTWAKRPCITGRRGQRLCSHRLLAGENALLLTAALASNGRLSGRGCCKESCPVHRICRMIVRILVRNSQIVNILGTSSEDALIQKSVLQ